MYDLNKSAKLQIEIVSCKRNHDSFQKVSINGANQAVPLTILHPEQSFSLSECKKSFQ